MAKANYVPTTQHLSKIESKEENRNFVAVSKIHNLHTVRIYGPEYCMQHFCEVFVVLANHRLSSFFIPFAHTHTHTHTLIESCFYLLNNINFIVCFFLAQSCQQLKYLISQYIFTIFTMAVVVAAATTTTTCWQFHWRKLIEVFYIFGIYSWLRIPKREHSFAMPHTTPLFSLLLLFFFVCMCLLLIHSDKIRKCWKNKFSNLLNAAGAAAVYNFKLWSKNARTHTRTDTVSYRHK